MRVIKVSLCSTECTNSYPDQAPVPQMKSGALCGGEVEGLQEFGAYAARLRGSRIVKDSGASHRPQALRKAVGHADRCT